MKPAELKLISRCYGSMSLFLSVAHNVFLLYYVDMFVNIYKIDKTSFWVGEVAFLVWNSVNDPLFGWLSDKKLLQRSRAGYKESSQLQIISDRVKSLQRNGPLFAFSFLLFWVHWLPTSLQFIVCLCLYDGFLTAVDLQHTALLADLTVQASERNNLNRYCSIYSTFGTLSVFLSYVLWSQSSTLPFQTFCLCIACFSAFGFYIASDILLRALPVVTKQAYVPTHQESDVGIVQYMKQLSGYKNFKWFALMNLIQVFHCHFNSNFFPLFMNALIGDAVPSTVCTLIIGFSFVAPHINNIYFLELCKKYGVYEVVNFLFWVKMLLAMWMLYLGSRHVWVTCLFIASNRIFTEGTCKLLNLVISDMVDEDFVLHNRERPVSALLFGTSSLLSKPGQTLAPLFGTLMLSAFTGNIFYQKFIELLQDILLVTGEDIFQTGLSGSFSVGTGKLSEETSAQASELYRDACFIILVLVPIACGLIQLFAWRNFSLRGARLNWIKSLRSSRYMECVC